MIEFLRDLLELVGCSGLLILGPVATCAQGYPKVAFVREIKQNTTKRLLLQV